MFQMRIRELREKAGYLTQQSFANAFGVKQSTVGNWEAGKRMPSIETSINLVSFLGTSLDYLFGLADKEDTMDDSPTFTPDETTLIYAYRKADTRSRQMVNLTLEPFIPPAQNSVAM